MDLPGSDWGDFSCRRAVDSSSLEWFYLTHLPLDKMAAISQTTFSNAFSWMKLLKFQLKFHWNLFLMLGLHQNATNLEQIYELKILDCLDLWAVVKLLSSDRKLVFTSFSGSNWHTSKQKVYNWPSNKSDLRPHHDRLSSSRPSHTIRKSIGINSGPRTTTMTRPTWYTCKRPATDLWCFATD